MIGWLWASLTISIRISYLPVIGVHEMHGRMHPNYWQITILLVVDLCSSLAYFMTTQPLPIAGKLPIKTLVAKQLPTNNIICYLFTFSGRDSIGMSGAALSSGSIWVIERVLERWIEYTYLIYHYYNFCFYTCLLSAILWALQTRVLQ